ncbi:MAG TPA: PEGA domain-containing protein, partial [Phycisphaerales bacterium]|nr:PEGA domain-containing protein [Phycisphaerales bacterium]
MRGRPRNHKATTRLVTFFVVPLLAGCATITRGTTDTLVITSEPPNADVRLSNGLTCRTPCSLAVKRNQNLVVKITREGYEPVEATVTPKVAGAGAAGMAGNVVLGGLIGAAVDAGSGAMYDLVPNPLHVKLVPLE